MKKKISKTQRKIYDKQMETVKSVFDGYFNEYYSNNRRLKSYSFYTMEDMLGYSVILEYDHFRQYVNYYIGQGVFGENIVNSCFELDSDGKKFLCHFVDILNAVDSDDLSFYTFEKCLIDKDIEQAAADIMAATEKYYNDINRVVMSSAKVRKIYAFYELDEYDEGLAKVEETEDTEFLLYGLERTYDELIRELDLDFKRKRLTEGFATRAYRVLHKMSRQELKKVQKENDAKSNATVSSKIIIAVPYVISAVICSVICAVAFYYIDKQIYSECVARNSLEHSLIGLFLGAVAGFCLFSLFPPSVYRLFTSGKKYDEIEQVLYANASNSVWGYVIIIGGCLIIWAFFICLFTFSGIGFTDDSVIYKEYVYSQKEEYSFENLEMCEIKTTYNEGSYVEYDGIAYAFKFGDAWYEFGVPNDDEYQIIQDNIQKYNIKVNKAYSVDSIEG